MRNIRRDLQFTLVNNNHFQLKEARKLPRAFPVIGADMHQLPFANGSFDGAMMLYTMCHADDAFAALREARRVVRPGGFFFMFDYEREYGDNEETWALLKAKFPYRSGFEALAELAGWRTVKWENPLGDDWVFRRAFGEHQDVYERLFGPLVPFIWKAQ
jgi:ubiquinone/menaquinone biosynthesis C-methylase UbiE